MVFADDLQARDGDVDHDGQDDPSQNDGNREDADDVRDERSVLLRLGCGGVGHVEAPLLTIASLCIVAGAGHADFTRQKVWALWPFML